MNRIKSSLDIMLETASPDSDPEGLITKYTQFESFRLVRDHHLNDMSGTLPDRLGVLMWYLIDYIGHRSAQYRIPLSANQIRFLNSPAPIAGAHPAVTIALLNFISRELPSHIRLDKPEVLREALYWWCIEKAPSAKLEETLVTEEQVSFLQTEEYAVGQPYSLNIFSHIYFARHIVLHELDMQKSSERAAYLYYLVLLACETPYYARFLPNNLLRSVFLTSNESKNNFDLIISKFTHSLNSDPHAAKKIRAKGRAIIEASHHQINGFRTNASVLRAGECFIKHRNIEKEVEPGVALVGPIDQTSGLGQATRLSYEILVRAEPIAPTALPFGLDNPAPVGFATLQPFSKFKNKREINLIHLNAESVPLAFAFEQEEIFRDSYNIAYFFWELTKIPKCHHLALNLLDEIWVSSEYNREIYASYTDKPVTNVGMAVEPLPKIRQVSRAEFGIDVDAVVFLTTFDSFSFIERKNPVGVIEAFQIAFPKGDERVQLVLKTQNRQRVTDPYQVRLWRKIDSLTRVDPRITIIDETLKYYDLLALKSVCDCYVSLHRSEGWGFGMIEAMQLAKPIIATAYSGNMEFCNEDNSFLIDYELVAPRPEEYIFVERGSQWADPNITKASEAMKSVVVNKVLAQLKGNKAAQFIEENFSVDAIAKKYSNRLLDIRASSEMRFSSTSSTS